MAGLSQHQSLSQSQVLAPQLQQSLQILQVPMLELRTLIQVELDGNPTLEMDDNDPNESKVEDKQRDAEEFDVEFDRLSKLDDEWRDYMAQSTNYVRRSTEDDERRQFFFDSLTKNETLQEHLLDQLRHTGGAAGALQTIKWSSSIARIVLRIHRYATGVIPPVLQAL